MKIAPKVPKIASVADSSQPILLSVSQRDRRRTARSSAIRQYRRVDIRDAPFLSIHAVAQANGSEAVISAETYSNMVENLEKRSAAAIGRLIAKGDLDPVEVAEFFLDRIERDRANPSFILVTRERALTEAAASRKRRREGRPAGPLDGVPVAWKDLVDMAGERTTAGSALYADLAPKQKDAPIVANLTAAGPWPWGKPISRNSHSPPWAQSAFRNAEKPPRCRDAPHRRRIVFGRGGRGRGRPCALRDRQRHRRLDPGASELLRHRRVQDERGADRQARRISALRAPSTRSARWRAPSRIAC